MAGLVCDIVTPAAKLYSNDAYMVVVPGVEGEMGFLQGYVQVTGQKVIILADRALPAESIDADKARADLAELEAKLAGMTAEEAALTTLAADISWCNAQLKAVAA